jgi:NAD(P)-dependent dehydrogenase (short-subunit alcohol dehydrogenase family)
MPASGSAHPRGARRARRGTFFVSQQVCYLASPGAAYVTGQTLLVDGGLTSY